MPKIYKRNCDYCRKYYEGYGERYCSRVCNLKASIGLRKEKHKGKHFSPNTEFKKGHIPISGFKKGHIPWDKGIKREKFSKETRKKMSEAHKGERSSTWRGGITPENERIRKGIEMKLWREAVFARDNWTCQKCGKESAGDIEAHHICNFADYIELRTSIENGITFCEKCHKKLHNRYGNKKTTRKQLEEFLTATISK